jgi:hypothetical protein
VVTRIGVLPVASIIIFKSIEYGGVLAKIPREVSNGKIMEMGYGTCQRKNQQEKYMLSQRGKSSPDAIQVKLSKVSLT